MDLRTLSEREFWYDSQARVYQFLSLDQLRTEIAQLERRVAKHNFVPDTIWLACAREAFRRKFRHQYRREPEARDL